ncbi:MAG: PAS domain S-box protein [Methanomicrobiales archaeon]|nr:PAS domain S-box protein [Methanomicrobiales archaeon]
MSGSSCPPDAVLEDRQASIAIARRQTEDRLRRSERRFTEVLDASPVPAALAQADGRYTLLNQKFTELLGYTLADIPAEEEWFERAFPDASEREEAAAAKVCTGRVWCRSGEEKTVRFRAVPLSDGTRYVACEEVSTPLQRLRGGASCRKEEPHLSRS